MLKDKKNRIENKLHYILKYMVLSMPLIILLLGCFRQTNVFLDSIYTLFNQFVSLPVNSWFVLLINHFNLTLSDKLAYILINYPLYIFWVYWLDLVLDIIVFMPKLFHKWIQEVI